MVLAASARGGLQRSWRRATRVSAAVLLLLLLQDLLLLLLLVQQQQQQRVLLLANLAFAPS